jgi:hypothetical protein
LAPELLGRVTVYGVQRAPIQAINPSMTGSQLQDLIVASLLRRLGGTARRWRLVLGTIRFHDPATHICNWSFAPSGDAREIAEVENMLDVLRLAHPRIEVD